MHTDPSNWANDTTYDEKLGWGITITNGFEDKGSIYPNLKSESEARAFKEGWNHHRRVTGDALLIRAVQPSKRRR